MDSKLKRLAILGSIAVMLMISLLVLYGNGYFDRDSQKQVAVSDLAKTPETTPDMRDPDMIGDDLRAFLYDRTFFDEEVSAIVEEARNSSARLSLIVTSVEKDLRVQVVDRNGEKVPGEEFYVAISDRGEYKDLDKDGIIYIGGLDAGEYSVKLMPLTCYIVPDNPTKVRVKDKVEYIAIDDISVLIKTEAEIDASVEDTGEADALSDADSSEDSSIKNSSGSVRMGIDVSKYQKDIDWDRVKNAGIEYAIIRAGYRGSKTGAIVVDPYYEKNMKEARTSGVKTGVYFFTQATNEVEAVEEASAVISLIKNYKLDYPVYIDTEGAGGHGRADGLDKETRTLVCEAFCRTVENAGYEAGVYASRNWYNNNLDVSRIEGFDIWLAEYRNTPLYQGYYNMWQYSSKGSVDGIEGNVDLDISYN